MTMKRKSTLKFCSLLGMLLLLTLIFPLSAEMTGGESLFDRLEEKIGVFMAEGKIPGLSLVVIQGKKQYIRGFGYADRSSKRPVDEDTLFELADCSKSFTALAILQLEQRGLIGLDDAVSDYFPWFYTLYDDQKQSITIRQLLYHTSGIPGDSSSRIPLHDGRAVLTQAVRNCSGINLNGTPGKKFEYSDVNYVILGAVIETVSALSFEDYMRRYVFQPLGLDATYVGIRDNDPGKSAGHKIGFFAPRRFESPVFRSHNPSAYVVSSGADMMRWLRLQMGLAATDLRELIDKSHEPDKSVRPGPNDISYASGWFVNQYKHKEIFYRGLNPGFSSYAAFRPEEKIGVVVLSNANSNYSKIIGEYVMKGLAGERGVEHGRLDHGLDQAFSLISFILVGYLLAIATYLILMMIEVAGGKRRFEWLNWKKAGILGAILLTFMPLLWGIYLLPPTIGHFSWPAALLWLPVSFPVAIGLVILCLGLTYLVYLLSLVIPHRNQYQDSVPFLVILSVVPGIANAALIFIVTKSLQSHIDLKYLVYYFCLALFIYIFGGKVGRTKLIKVSNGLVLDLRMKLVNKIFGTTYQKFEKIDRGRVYETLNTDIGVIGGSLLNLIPIASNLITALAIFVYLSVLSLLATVITSIVILILFIMYYVTTQRANVYFEEARDSRNVYMRLIDGLLNGYKELRIHGLKMRAYKREIEDISKTFREKNNIARIKFVNVNRIGESMIIVVLGVITFAFPRIFPDIRTFVLMGFIMVLLYLIGPINTILNMLPSLVELKVSWKRVQQFIREIPDVSSRGSIETVIPERRAVDHFVVKDIMFSYDSRSKDERFSVGPINFELGRGEIMFIVGGNGSGKTTLAKILTGLYVPDKGSIEINGEVVENSRLGEYFSVVFSDFHLFEKLYDADLDRKKVEIETYFKLLNLEEKVHVNGDRFSTIDLSGGQRKRLALLKCFIEDRPIYLFDEWAADQDPHFRRFFYHSLLKRMKEEGKIIMAITHDDHYFDVADKIIKMDMGKIDLIENGSKKKVCPVDMEMALPGFQDDYKEAKYV